MNTSDDNVDNNDGTNASAHDDDDDDNDLLPKLGAAKFTFHAFI